MKDGPTLHGPTSGKTFMRPIITYALFASALHVSSGKKCRAKKEIRMMPTTLSTPPLQTEHYPREYRLTCKQPLRKHAWSRSLGNLAISASEPPALNTATSNPRASSLLRVQLIFTPSCKTLAQTERPYDWDITVKSALRARTFYTTKPFSQTPTLETAGSDPLIQEVSRITKSETRRCDTLPWRLHRLSSHGTIIAANPNLPWTATLTMPINACKDLVPTFLCPLSARRYSLSLQFTIANLSHTTLDLEVPIQIIHDPSPQSQNLSLSQEYFNEDARILGDLGSLGLGDEFDIDPIRAIKPPPYSKHI